MGPRDWRKRDRSLSFGLLLLLRLPLQRQLSLVAVLVLVSGCIFGRVRKCDEFRNERNFFFCFEQIRCFSEESEWGVNNVEIDGL
jgi:hypothetical protein